MGEHGWIAAVAACVAVGLARGTAPLARARGWTDPRPAAPVLERKRGQLPVPFTGAWSLGLGGLAGLVAAGLLGLSPASAGWCAPDVDPLLAGALLLGAAAFGLADDLRPGGLPAAVQLGVQALLCAPLVVLWGAWIVPFGLVVFAAVNTADHSDGWCAGFGTAAGLPTAPCLGGAALGFLGANLDRGLRGARGPTAFLGDGGSNLLAMWLLMQPSLWPALVVPAADLARVSLERALRGHPPWRGDRSHLGQRLEAAGWPLSARLAVWAALVVAAAKGASGPELHAGATPLPIGVGAALAALLAVGLGVRPPRWPGRSRG
jgi:hypothetical protein